MKNLEKSRTRNKELARENDEQYFWTLLSKKTFQTLKMASYWKLLAKILVEKK